MDDVRVLCVDDEPGFASLVADHLEHRLDAVDARTFDDPEPALAAVDEGGVDCVISDYEMPGTTGLELLEAVRDRDEDLPFILFTGKGSETIASEAISRGVTDYLQKSGDASVYDVLANRVENAVERYRARRAATRHRELLETILVASPVGIVVHEADGDAVLANDRARDLLGVTDGEGSLDVAGYEAADWELLTPSGDPVGTDRLPARRVVDEGGPAYGLEYVLEAADGATRPIYANAVPIETGDGVEQVVVAFDTRSNGGT